MKLLNLLRSRLNKKTVGTLILGKKDSFREIFFEKDRVYLCGNRFSGKIDVEGLTSTGLLGSRITSSHIETVLVGCDLTARIAPEVFREQGLIGEKELKTLAQRHMREEILELVLRNKDSFHFQEGRVPEKLLQEANGMASRTPLSLSALSDEVNKRIEAIRVIRSILPSLDETFVVTAQGMALTQKHPELFSLQRLLGLIDGFRNLHSLVRDTSFFEYFLLRLIVECLKKDYLKKVVLPELKGVSLTALSVADARRLLPHYKNAVAYGVDQLGARERLALIYEKLGDNEQAVVQYNFVGDTLFRMGKASQAVKAYQRALSLNPDEILVVDKIMRIYRHAANQELQNGSPRQAVQLLENALGLRPDDPEVFLKLMEALKAEKNPKRLSELCDKVIVFARRSGQPEIAIRACREALSHFPQNPTLLKKLINVYIDTGDSQRATAELGELARSYVEWGQPQRAVELLDKIKRVGMLSPELASIKKDLERKTGGLLTPRKRRRVPIAVLAVLLFGFAAYQIWSFVAWSEIRGSTVALAAVPQPDGPGAEVRLLPSREEMDNQRLASDCRAFSERFPISVFRVAAQQTERRAQLRASTLAAKRRERKRRILNDATLKAAEGERQAAATTLEPLLGLEDDDVYRTKAEVLLRKIGGLGKSADQLFEDGAQLERQKEWVAAYQHYQKLLRTYPTSRRIKELSLPVLLMTLPARAELQKITGDGKREALGQAPVVVHLTPDEVIQVESSAPGHSVLKTDVSARGGCPRLLVLSRMELASVELNSPLDFDPAIGGHLALCATKKGTVRAIQLKSGKTAWSVTRTDLKNLVCPPLITPEGVYAVWNDSEIWLLESSPPGSRAVIKARARLQGFASCPALLLENGLLLAGTGRKILHVFRRGSLDPVRQFTLESQPVALTPLTSNAVVVSTEEGGIFAQDFLTGAVLWKRVFDPPPRSPPASLGRSLCLLTRDWNLHLLDPDSGSNQHVLPLSQDHRISFDTRGRRILVLEPTGWLRSLAPATGKPAAERNLGPKATSIKVVGRSIAVRQEKRTDLLVLDSQSLEPRWSTSAPFTIANVGAGGKYLVTASANGHLLIYLNE